jgi:transcriptional regulator with XRE-family HTH domain
MAKGESTMKTGVRMTDAQAYIDIGDRIKAARMQAGLSQTDLGERLGVTFQQIQKYEKGRNRVPADRVVKMTAILGRPISYFLPEVDGGTIPADDGLSTKLFATSSGLRMAKAFVASDPKVQQAMRYAVEGIAKAYGYIPS